MWCERASQQRNYITVYCSNYFHLCYNPNMKRILMCRPTYFSIVYEINPWMDVTNQVDSQKAKAQWQQLYDFYLDHGITVELIDPVEGLPDMVFTANEGIIRNNIFVAGNFRYAERKGEEQYFQKWFKEHGYEVKKLDYFQGGEGDALFFRDTLYMGYGFRSDKEVHKQVGDILQVPTVSLHLIDPYFYDFDTAFCPVGDKCVLYYPEAFDSESKLLLSQIPDAIPMTKIQARNFVGNSVYVNDALLVGYEDETLLDNLKSYDVKTHRLDMSEFKKSGGGIKCLTLYLE